MESEKSSVGQLSWFLVLLKYSGGGIVVRFHDGTHNHADIPPWERTSCSYININTNVVSWFSRQRWEWCTTLQYITVLQYHSTAVLHDNTTLLHYSTTVLQDYRTTGLHDYSATVVYTNAERRVYGQISTRPSHSRHFRWVRPQRHMPSKVDFGENRVLL